MSEKFLKYSLFGLIGLTMLMFSPASASAVDKGKNSMSIPGIYMGEIYLTENKEPITIRLGADGNLTYITTPELIKETAAVGSWELVSKADGIDEIDFAAVIYIQAKFCKQIFGVLDCVGFVGGTLSIDQDGEVMGTMGFSVRRADNTGDTINFGTSFAMELHKLSLQEILSLATTPTP